MFRWRLRADDAADSLWGGVAESRACLIETAENIAAAIERATWNNTLFDDRILVQPWGVLREILWRGAMTRCASSRLVNETKRPPYTSFFAEFREF